MPENAKAAAARPWGEALAVLASGLGVAVEAPGSGPADLGTALLGLGFSGRVLTLDGDDVPAVPGGGLLIELADGGWASLLDVGGSFRGADGSVVEGLADWPRTGRAVMVEPVPSAVGGPLSFLRRYKARAVEVMLAGLLINLFSLCFPLFGSFVYDKVLGNGISETLWALAVGLAIVVGLDFLVRGTRALVVERFAQAAEGDIDRSVFDKALSGNVAAMPSVGRVLDQYKQILGSRDFLSSSAMLAAVDVPFLVLFLLVIAIIGGPLVLVPLLLGAAMIGVNALFAIPTLEAEAEARKAGEVRFGLLAETLTAREAVVGGRFADTLRRDWRRVSLRAGLASGRSRFWHALSFASTASFTNLSYVGVMVTGAYMIEAHDLSTGRLMACSIIASRAMSALSAIVSLTVRLREFRRALAAMDETLPSPAAAAPPRLRGRLSGEVRLVGVSCRLRGDGPPTLDNLELTVAPGEMLGIAGPPGAGKTTLLRLVAGSLRPASGQVLIDHVPVAALHPHDVSLNLGYKPQDPCLLDGTLEENLRFGRADLDPAAVEAALRASGLLPSLEKGDLTLATPVGPRGSSLSGGQRQMAALARTLIGDPAVLLLDEPTTGLDAPTEQRLAESLAARKGRATILACTHSRPLLSLCDRILVLDHGRVVALGPRDRVLAG